MNIGIDKTIVLFLLGLLVLNVIIMFILKKRLNFLKKELKNRMEIINKIVEIDSTNKGTVEELLKKDIQELEKILNECKKES